MHKRFSERAFGSVSGLKWHDANADGNTQLAISGV